MTNQKEADSGAPKQAAASQKAKRKADDRARIAAIRKQKETEKKQAFEKKQSRKATLITLSKADRKNFIKNEKLTKQQQKEQAKADKLQQRKAFAALSADQKTAKRKADRHQKKLDKKAKKGYVARQIVKYTLLAVVAVGVIYLGNVAYGMFFDNSYAFQDSDQTILTPPPQTQTPAPTVSTMPSSTPTPTVDPYDMLLSQADLDFMENRVNILVLGIDESLERSNWNSFRTDTMIFMSIDFETNNVYMISLPRDSFVWIYGKDTRARINTAFSAGGGYNGNGFEYSMNTVSLLLGGVPVNHYVCFDMNVVKEVVNAIGGLDYDVDIEFTMCGRHMDKGYQHLDGQAVLDYCRERHVDSDIGRTARQRAMIMAIFAEMKNTGQIKDVPAIYSAITGNIYTDLSFEQICSLAAFAMKLDTDSIHEYALEGGFLNIDGTSLWGIDQYKKRDMVYEIFGTKISVSESDHVTYLQGLAAQKRAVVAAAKSAATSAQSYVDTNKAYILPAELTQFNTKKADLLAVAAVVSISDVESTIQPIIDATNALNTWLNDTLKPAIKTRKDAAAATPTPKPTATATATPTPSVTPTPTATATPEPTAGP